MVAAEQHEVDLDLGLDLGLGPDLYLVRLRSRRGSFHSNVLEAAALRGLYP